MTQRFLVKSLAGELLAITRNPEPIEGFVLVPAVEGTKTMAKELERAPNDPVAQRVAYLWGEGKPCPEADYRAVRGYLSCVCAWCGKTLSTAKAGHGICEECGIEWQK